MLQATPFLLFDGNCAEAMTFYHECLGGELTLTKLGDTPMKEQFPKEKHNRIINALTNWVGLRRGRVPWRSGWPGCAMPRPAWGKWSADGRAPYGS